MQMVCKIRSDDSSLSHLLLFFSQITTVNFKKLRSFKKEVTIALLLTRNTCPQYFMNIVSDFSHL